MFYEDCAIKRGDTLWDLAVAYGYQGKDWKKIWEDPKNAGLLARRKKPELCQPGDVLMVPIPWTAVSTSLTLKNNGAEMIVERDGERGKRLSFVQTVYRHNQPIGPNPNPFCVDACTPDDDLPFYWTAPEIQADPERRRRFYDYSSRNAPTEAMGTTKWRAIVSICVVTEKRVTIWDSQVWGWDMTPKQEMSMIGPRDATGFEVSGHLHLLRTGVGTGPIDFGKMGWSFRTP